MDEIEASDLHGQKHLSVLPPQERALRSKCVVADRLCRF